MDLSTIELIVFCICGVVIGTLIYCVGYTTGKRDEFYDHDYAPKDQYCDCKKITKFTKRD